MAYQAHFTEQGIPSSMALISAHQMRNLRAEQLVEAAIRANKLSSQLSTDREYSSAVKFLLQMPIVR